MAKAMKPGSGRRKSGSTKRGAASSPADLTANQALNAIRSGDLTSEGLVAACLERIQTLEPQVKAWAFLDPAHAMAQASAADAAIREGKGLGALHGLPVGIKDVIDTADMPTEGGSALFKDYRPRNDASCVSALRSAGAVIMGKTVTTELASSTPGPTCNPRNLAHTPGGSSSGSAAAVACGMVPLALGTQTAGSVIRPASFCGIFGFKPTLGLISRHGVILQSHTLDTIGVYGRTVEDLALIADAIGVHDPQDPVSIRAARSRLTEIAASDPPLAPIFAFVRTPSWDRMTEIACEAFGELVAELGGRVEEIDMPSLAQAIECQRIVQSAENAAYYGIFRERAPELLSEGLSERLKSGSRIAAQDYIRAVNLREPLYASLDEVLTQYSAIVTPASLGPAPKGLASTGDPAMNGLWTFLGVPCVTLPLLEAEGLPVGVQMIGARRDEGRLLRSARWLVRHLAGEV
jgi:Asp-tRNA(Asn)/Glu-tRNA(Gln) amidotransferase A subunit family amidase